MLVTKEIEIDMGHRVPNHKSKCKNLHGHRYRIEVGVDDKVVTTEGSSDEGMVIDFSDLKQIMVEELDSQYDHGLVLYEKDPLVELLTNPKYETGGIQRLTVTYFIPTAENLAKHWYEIMKQRLEGKKIQIKHVKVWETPTSTATYGE